MNTVSLIGRLTKDVDLRYTPKGNAIGRFILAVNRRVANQNGEKMADFISCQIWNKPAETLAQYTQKGTLIGINGRIQTGSYDNQQGQKVYTTDVVVESFDFLENKDKNGNAERAYTPSGSTNDYGFDILDDDLPF